MHPTDPGIHKEPSVTDRGGEGSALDGVWSGGVCFIKKT